MSSSSSSSSSFFSSSAAAAGAAAAAAAGAAAAPTHHQTSHSPTRSTQDIEDILAVAVGSEHSRPVGSNGVAGGLHEVVEVLLLPHTQRPTVISTLASARVRVAREMMSSSFSIVDIPSNMGMFNDHLHIGYNPPIPPRFHLHSISSHQISSKPTESD